VKYLCLVYGPSAGQAERLRPASTATTVRVRDGQTLVMDGPFAETTDELTGFLVVECEGMDEALARARGLRGASVEIRPAYVGAPS
jgi:hypothetical protein